MIEKTEILQAAHRPHVGALVDELQSAVSSASSWFSRKALAEDSRWCVWGGQSDDGLKHGRSRNGGPFPWEGASDTRIRLVDRLTRTANMICLSAFRRGRMNVAPNEATDGRKSGRMALLLKWLTRSSMRDHAGAELDLAVNWRNGYGLSLMHCEWERQTALRLEVVKAEQLVEKLGLGEFVRQVGGADQVKAFLQKAGSDGITQVQERVYQELANAMDLLLNEEREAELVDTLGKVFPSVRERELRNMARELRKSGTARVPVPYVVKDRPRWRALRVFEDVFFPADTETVSRAAWIAVREWLTLADCRGRVETEGWNASFVDELEKQKVDGAGVTELSESSARTGRRWSGGGSHEAFASDYSGLYEILTFYYWATDDYGVRGLYKTVCSAQLSAKAKAEAKFEGGADEVAAASEPDKVMPFALHELCSEFEEYPFVEFVYARTDRALVDNTGIPWLLYTYQNEQKAMRDFRIDNASISILPPIKRPMRDMGNELILGPGSVVAESISGQMSFMEPPGGRTALGREIEECIGCEADRFVGAWNPAIPAPEIQLRQQHLADTFLGEMEQLLTMTLKAAQRELPEEVTVRVTGLREQNRITREEIQGEFDTSVVFDARELDTEQMQAKAKQVLEVARIDSKRRIDPGRLVEVLLDLIDPNVAQVVLDAPEEAARKEVEAEQDALAKMMLGIEPPYRDSGENWALRRKWLEGQFDPQNPAANPKAIRMLQSGDANLQKLVENRIKHFDFMEQQSRNKETGKVGVKPVYGE